MARGQHKQQDFNFQTVQLFKDQTLGTGSYGAVCRAKCDQLPCAAKLLYPVLFNLRDPLQAAHNAPPDRDHRLPLVRFERECQFLSQIKHPNIVQYLGTYRDPDTNAPVLLSELMDESLTHFLETSQGPLLFHVQLNILHDTALAISYLHSNAIIHRDLSSNNVLLVAGSRAKVTDFGMSKLTDAAAPRIASLTLCPGTAGYMSPEALDEPPMYSEKLDCFSFGVLTIQVSTQEFPKPTDRFEMIQVPNPRQPSRKIQARVPVPEVERRQSHISLVPPTHPLLPIALNCLKNRDVERPTAQQLCQRLEGLKRIPLYASSIQQIRDKDRLLQDQRHTILHHEQQLQTKDDHLATLKEHLTAQLEENHLLRQQLQEKDAQVQELQSQIQQLELREEHQHHLEVRSKQISKITFELRKCPQAPCKMTAGSSTTNEHTTYFKSRMSRVVYKYDTQNRLWSALPQHFHDLVTIVIINGLLTAVGGVDGRGNTTNKLLSLKNEKWVEHFPPMPTKRSVPTTLCSRNTVIVAGGWDDRGLLSCVEMLDTDTLQWSTASPLPYDIDCASATVCGDDIYITGGFTGSIVFSILHCSLQALLQSSRPATTGTQQSSTPPAQSKVWHNTADLPVNHSTCAMVHGHLLAIGGMDSQGKRTAAIHKYNSLNNTWEVISQMSVARSQCLAAVLPDNELMIIGGWTDKGLTNEVETVSMCVTK